MTRPFHFALMAAFLGIVPNALGQSRTLEDGTLVVSPVVMAAEMIVDEGKAKRKYAGKAIQIEAPLTDKLTTARGLDLTIVITPPGYVGYKKFWCRSTDKSSAAAAEALSAGDKVTIVGIYQPETRGDIPAAEINSLPGGPGSDWHATIRLDSCLLLTGNSSGESKRRNVAAEASTRQEEKKR